MSVSYWAMSIRCGAAECGLVITEEQIQCLAEYVEGDFENYGLANYCPPPPIKADPPPKRRRRRLTNEEKAARKVATEQGEKILINAIAEVILGADGRKK